MLACNPAAGVNLCKPPAVLTGSLVALPAMRLVLMQTVRMIDAASGEIITIAGSGEEGFSGDGGPATEATLHLPTSLAFDAQAGC